MRSVGSPRGLSGAGGFQTLTDGRQRRVNAARHSGADRVDLRLEQAGSGVRLWVSDQGHGFDTADPGGGFGLILMRERARSVGAELVVSSVPGHGSRVEVTL